MKDYYKILGVEKGAGTEETKKVRQASPTDKDESMWETVIDFTKIRKGGIPAEEVLKALRKLNAASREASFEVRPR